MTELTPTQDDRPATRIGRRSLLQMTTAGVAAFGFASLANASKSKAQTMTNE